MLENSNLFSGSKAKELETLVKQYEDVSIQLKDLEITKKEVLSRIFEIASVGINETPNMVFNVCENKGRVSIAPKKLLEVAPNIYAKIESLNLISTGEDYLTLRGIKHKTNI